MKKTILMVDDSRVVRQVGSMSLRSGGFDVIEAEHGRDAIKKIQGRKIDLIITDINMPEMDGIELIKQLKLMPEFKFIPIIVLSTVSQEDKVKEGYAAGAAGWLYKPYNGAELMQTVRKFLQ